MCAPRSPPHISVRDHTLFTPPSSPRCCPSGSFCLSLARSIFLSHTHCCSLQVRHWSQVQVLLKAAAAPTCDTTCRSRRRWLGYPYPFSWPPGREPEMLRMPKLHWMPLCYTAQERRRGQGEGVCENRMLIRGREGSTKPAFNTFLRFRFSSMCAQSSCVRLSMVCVGFSPLALCLALSLRVSVGQV